MLIQEISVNELSFTYQYQSIFDRLSFSCKTGEIVGLVGANGTGKTTLLKILARLILLESQPLLINQANTDVVLEGYQEQIHYLGHKPGLNGNLTLLENLRYDSVIFNQDIPSNVTRLLHDWSLFDQRKCLARELSFGQQRKVGLLRLSCFPSQVWLLDEPFTGLDREACTLLANLIQKHVQNQGIVILSSHQNLSQYGLIMDSSIAL